MSLSIFSNFGLTSGSALSPADIAGLTLWLDASDTSTITESGGSVSQWDDKSGNGYHVAQATAARQPTTGTRTINSLNVIDFDGSSDYIDNGSLVLTQPFTEFMVFQQDNVDGIKTIRNSTNTQQAAFYTSNFAYGLQIPPNNATGGTADLLAHYATLIFDDTNSRFDIDSTTVVTTTGTTGFNGVRLGASGAGTNRLDGVIGEHLIFDRALSAGEIAEVEAYLQSKWNL